MWYIHVLVYYDVTTLNAGHIVQKVQIVGMRTCEVWVWCACGWHAEGDGQMCWCACMCCKPMWISIEKKKNLTWVGWIHAHVCGGFACGVRVVGMQREGWMHWHPCMHWHNCVPTWISVKKKEAKKRKHLPECGGCVRVCMHADVLRADIDE